MHYVGVAFSTGEEFDASYNRGAPLDFPLGGRIVSDKNSLRTIYEERKDKTLFIAADGTLRYGDIVEVIDAAKGAGVEKVGIITEGMRRAAAAPGRVGGN